MLDGSRMRVTVIPDVLPDARPFQLREPRA